MAVKLKAPEGCGSASVAGAQYEVKKGFVSVPDEAVLALLDHGFTVAGDAQAKDAPAEAAV